MLLLVACLRYHELCADPDLNLLAQVLPQTDFRKDLEVDDMDIVRVLCPLCKLTVALSTLASTVRSGGAWNDPGGGV